MLYRLRYQSGTLCYVTRYGTMNNLSGSALGAVALYLSEFKLRAADFLYILLEPLSDERYQFSLTEPYPRLPGIPAFSSGLEVTLQTTELYLFEY